MTEALAIREQGSILAVIERASTDPNVDVAKMEKLLELAERVHARQAEAEYDRAMNAAQAEMRPVATDSDNPQTRSRYASYGALDRAVRPIYSTHGFSLSFGTRSPAIDRVTVTCRVSHRAGHTERVEIEMPADGRGAKGGDVMTKTHATGSAVSYGMRYLLKMIFNLAIGEYDDDGNAAGKATRRQATPTTPKPTPTKTANATPPEATPEQKAKFLTMLAPVKDAALRYANEQGWLLPNEGLGDIHLSKVPTTQKQFQSIMDGIRALMDGEDQIPGAEVPPDKDDWDNQKAIEEEFELSKPDEAWRELLVPFGKNKGERFGALEKGQLWWWCVKWMPEPYTSPKNGKTYPPKESDLELRKILDEVREKYKFTDTIKD